jgi:ABC-type sugar transport system permease subunit
VWENIPLPVLVLSAGLSQVSDHAVEAARDLGAKAPRILWEILLPQMRRSLLIAFALIFILYAFHAIRFSASPPLAVNTILSLLSELILELIRTGDLVSPWSPREKVIENIWEYSQYHRRYKVT